MTKPGNSMIIEANSYSNPDILQVHSLLLADDDICRFYSWHDIL